MLRYQSFKFQLIPTKEQEQIFRQTAGCRRFVYNKGLALNIERHKNGEKHLSSFQMQKLLTTWKKQPDMLFLAEVTWQATSSALDDLDKAYKNFFAGRAKFPKFKKRGCKDSFRYWQSIKLDEDNRKVWLSKIGWVRVRNHRKVFGEIYEITISLKCGKWYASIGTKIDVEPSGHTNTGGDVGIDMGIVRFATLSNGKYYEPLNSFKHHQTALRKANQSLSRKKKFSSNWKKAKAKVGRIHNRIANCRKDYLHKTSAHIVKNHGVVCIEDLQIQNMSATASGTIDNPGRNVAAKSGLNKSILDQGWFMFRVMLQYKLDWAGGILVPVPPRNTSRTCPSCGNVSKDNRLTQSEFICVSCGYKNNADNVGAINVLRAGHARLACEVNGAVIPSAAGNPKP